VVLPSTGFFLAKGNAVVLIHSFFQMLLPYTSVHNYFLNYIATEAQT